MNKVSIYTDGSCWPNPGPGGWAFLIEFQSGDRIERSGASEVSTTNNRMEMKAAIEALEFLSPSHSVTIYTDSQYLQIGALYRMLHWHRKNWRTQHSFIKNHDLWMQVWDLCRKHNVLWEWVRGHDKCEQNNRCDKLAEAARVRVNFGKVGQH